MCTAHRKSVLSEIKERLKLKQRDKILCISTQVIEAGVDISFDAVIRLCAGLDSIVQAAGRCNRNGEGRPDAPVWIVDCCDENLTVLKDISDAKEATQSLIYSFEKEAGRFDSDLSSDKSVRFFYEKLYTAKNRDFFDFVKQGYPSVYSMLAGNTRYTGKRAKDSFCIRRLRPQAACLKYSIKIKQAWLFRGAKARELPKNLFPRGNM